MQTSTTGTNEIEKAARFVSMGRCPLCGSRLRRVVCGCVRGGFFGRPHKRPNPNCHDCGGQGYTRQCPTDHKLLGIKD